MKEIRVTFRNEDFAAVSRSLVDLGIVFQVEPFDGADAVVASRGRPERIPIAPRAGQTKGGRPKPAAKTSTVATSAPGARRLRDIAERNRVSSGEAGQRQEEPSPLPNPSEKLLPYGNRQET